MFKTKTAPGKAKRVKGQGPIREEIVTDKPWPTVNELRKLMESRGPDALLSVCSLRNFIFFGECREPGKKRVKNSVCSFNEQKI
jgi:hypothetical protein